MSSFTGTHALGAGGGGNFMQPEDCNVEVCCIQKGDLICVPNAPSIYDKSTFTARGRLEK